MGLRKLLDLVESQYGIFVSVFENVNVRLTAIADELNNKKRPTLKSRIIAVRNWITHLLLWLILVLLLSSCFVSGRSIHIVTPKVDVSADTATAYSWPYNSKFQ